ncbi:3-deoxy-7-phosphoheptulonate synthase [Nocardia sp. CDC159]|uniref:Phospho-2-dehydro-3-deoxyheptonate aldolase n=1 Tax=Nocardia pulmonis TaxID=2951408 RepID=A0A9X2EEP8_9NOCA|nr:MULTISPECIES: 3-deoxy-7-phosphoheptulonate synthase [Nocardia]MCM6779061.1 3-deoxy-7-phosphoheptulonate synthase [Nocardia pulmonis]MCM6791951.1 3-deoxy-7-phosphoheptulonate synthase [Nocardia sp. CDC159]
MSAPIPGSTWGLDGVARQQPEWADHADIAPVRAYLDRAAPLVQPEEVRALRDRLADVAEGRAHVLQVGDCAEVLAESTEADFAAKTDFLARMSANFSDLTDLPVVPIGRFAGQFAKPRSSPTERVGGIELPSYRGDLVNGLGPTLAERAHEPTRMLRVHDFSRAALRHLASRRLPGGNGPWASHEALVLDYEVPQIRGNSDGTQTLTSTHFPWIGERTRGLDSSHVAMLAAVDNPIGLKVGPTMTADDLRKLCGTLDPHRQPGRLTLISRIGSAKVRDRLPELAEAVRDAGHPVVWLCDPMHGNTFTTATGVKTRRVADAVAEVVGFVEALTGSGIWPGGLHLETSPAAVTECIGLNVSEDHLLTGRYRSSCDPRLNPGQTCQVITAYATAALRLPA